MKQLAFLPVGLFGAVMGLSGLCIAWRLAHGLFGAPQWIGEAIGALAFVAFVILALAYLAKFVRYPSRVASEWRNPVIGPLFATMFISCLLLARVILPYAELPAEAMWILGAVPTSAFTVVSVYRWIHHKTEIDHASPSWFVPVVGDLNIPSAGMFEGHASVHEFYLYCVAVGLVFAIVLFTLVFARLVFRPALADALQPTLAILTAPFGVGFLGYTRTIGIDLLATILFYGGVFVLIVLTPILLRQAMTRPFHVSWWAIGFPFAALAASGEEYALATGDDFSFCLGVAVLLAVTLAIAWVLAQTLIHLLRGDLLAPDIEAALKAEARR
jgi:tellurite resistance protein